MATIDADAHVNETPATWSYLRDFEAEFRPQLYRRVTGGAGSPPRGAIEEGWFIDGRLHARNVNVGADIPEDSRDLTAVVRRLAHMDEIGVDIQILYPSLFLRPVTLEHDLEFAIVRSYNRWLASIWQQASNRLRWVAMPPLLSLVDPTKVRAELEFCKAHSACAIFMRGMECERLITHRYFFPLYEMAQELDLALTFHAGINSFAVWDEIPLNGGNLHLFKFPVMGAFCALLETEVPKRFPKLRWGFIEASAQWVPYVLGEVRLRLERRGQLLSSTALEDANFYITTQRSDDLPWLLDQIGAQSLLLGTDYGHRDTASEVGAFARMLADPSIASATRVKILETNPAALYGIAS